MTELPAIAITLSDEFPHLSHAPIVEAVIQIQARAETMGEPSEWKTRLQDALPEYPNVKTVNSLAVMWRLDMANKESPKPPQSEQTWMGLRLETGDSRHIAQFTRDFFSFSRLTPYEDWGKFIHEAMRLWSIHRELAGPTEIQRIGVRCINRLEVPSVGPQISEYFSGLAAAPSKFPTVNFLYQNQLAIPGHPYGVTLIRTIQPQSSPDATTIGLLLDIDVFCSTPFAPNPDIMDKRLAEMRWIKNHVFFDSVTDKALELCR
ncbi:MAG: TIGR04255 family protein [Phycisphaerales bacterium]